MYAYDQGQFLPVLIPFKDKQEDYISSKQQAIQILDTATTALSLQDAACVYITYSANQGQTERIAQAYKDGDWKTGIGGANQADVMHTMEDLMASEAKYTELQGKMKIAPITTIPNNTDLTVWSGVINHDLNRIKGYLQGSNIVFGWMNQDTAPKFAHALNSPTGVVKSFPAQISDLVQNALIEFAKDYPALPAPK